MSSISSGEQIPRIAEHLFENVDQRPPKSFPGPEGFHEGLETLAANAHPDITARFFKFQSGGVQREVFYMAPSGSERSHRMRPIQVNQHPHSNEVAPNESVLRLASVLASDPERFRDAGASGLAVYDADPENARRNGETLFSPGIWQVYGYMRDAFRSNAQVDLDFSGKYKGSYEFNLSPDHSSYGSKLGTVALADFLKPGLYIPAHNFGINDGSNSYVSHNSAAYNELRGRTLVAAQVPYGSTAETPHQQQFAPGVYEHFGIRILARSAEAHDRQLAGVGMASIDVMTALNPNTFCVMDETPYFQLSRTTERLGREEAVNTVFHLEQLQYRMEEILTPIEQAPELLDTDNKRAFFESSYAPLQRWRVFINDVKTLLDQGAMPEKFWRVVPFYMGISLGMANRLHEEVTGVESEAALTTLWSVAELYQDAEFMSHEKLVKSQLGAYASGMVASAEKDYTPMNDDVSVEVPEYHFPRELQQLVHR